MSTDTEDLDYVYRPGGPLCGCNRCEQVRAELGDGTEELTDAQLADSHQRQEIPGDQWGIRHPDGTIEPAGILGENRARMVAHHVGGQVIPPCDGGA